ncbi:MAG: DUF6057 family protein [Candidatus Azobacteroides sp.]|nr:DUF6057 family protein [Candidatus Azobacteroides sp.]
MTKELSRNFIQRLNISGSILFYAFIFLFLVKYKTSLFFRLQELSLFLPTSSFRISCMEEPGGFIFYIAAFFLQFFYYPWLGITLFIFLLVVIQYLVIKVFALNDRYYSFSLLPATLLVLSFTRLDYVMYVMPEKQLIYFWVTGFISLLLLLFFYRSLRLGTGKLLYIFFSLAIFFPFLGTYVLIAVLWMGIYEVLISGICRQSLFLFFTGLLFVGGIPVAYFYILYETLDLNRIWLYGLSLWSFGDGWQMWIPFFLLMILPFLYLLFYRKKPIGKYSSKQCIGNGLLLVGCITGIVLFSFRDKNFHIQLEMENALVNRNFDRILEIADNNKENTPTRLIILYRNIALHRNKLLLDKMFTYSHGAESYFSSVPVNATLIGSPAVFYYYGRLNFSYRWCMELSVSCGMNVDYLKYMVKNALFNNEPELALKYVRILEKTFFHKKWAEKYRIFIENPDLFREEDEFREIYALTLYHEGTWENSNNVESCIMSFYRKLPSGTKSMLELSLASAMTTKDIKAFMSKLGVYLTQNQSFPVHLQEAALLFSKLEGYEVNREYFNPLLLEKYERYLQRMHGLKGSPEEIIAQHIKNEFGDTYWYYYFFIKGMTTS